MNDEPKTARDLYKSLEPRREQFLRRARDLASLLIPSLYPPKGYQPGASLPDPQQSLGARGVNNLASKLILVLFPPNDPFYRYTLTPKAQEAVKDDSDLRASVESGLADREYQILREFEAMQFRTTAFQCARHLLVAGNCLQYVPNEGPTRYYGLDQYVVRRDGKGDVLDIVLKQCVSRRTLKPAVLESISKTSPNNERETPATDDVDVYTHIARGEDRWEVTQEIEGVKIEEGSGHSPLDDPHWFPLRFTRIDGEDYGRSFAEDYAGDLGLLETLSQCVGESALAAAKTIFGVKPGAIVTPKDLEECKNLGFVTAEPEDVFAIQVEKQADLQTALRAMTELRQSLSMAFLLNSGVQRDAERVTAEEIRFVAQEIEGIGGPYALLRDEWQLPAVLRAEKRLSSQKGLKALPKGVDVIIVAGLEALGRKADLTRVQRSFAFLAQTLGPTFLQRINPDWVIRTVLTSEGINAKDALRSEEDIAAEQQQAQQMSLTEKLGPEAIRQVGAQMQQQQQSQGTPPNG